MGYGDPVLVPKLVRDKMPAIWEAHGDIVEFHFIDGAARQTALREKLVEEAAEVANAATTAEIRSELGDVLDVMLAIAGEYNIEWTDVVEAMQDKQVDRGGWTCGVYLTKFEWGPLRQPGGPGVVR